MCGIIGIVSKNQVVDRLIDGLECLEYRGYDSAGIATISKSELACSKSTGKLVSLKNKLKMVRFKFPVLIVLKLLGFLKAILVRLDVLLVRVFSVQVTS